MADERLSEERIAEIEELSSSTRADLIKLEIGRDSSGRGPHFFCDAVDALLADRRAREAEHAAEIERLKAENAAAVEVIAEELGRRTDALHELADSTATITRLRTALEATAEALRILFPYAEDVLGLCAGTSTADGIRRDVKQAHKALALAESALADPSPTSPAGETERLSEGETHV